MCDHPWTEGPGVQLHNADMLSSDLSGVGVLVLANQCWDEDLMAQVRTHQGI